MLHALAFVRILVWLMIWHQAWMRLTLRVEHLTLRAPAWLLRSDVSYRYIILNDKTNSAVWESEPNRYEPA